MSNQNVSKIAKENEPLLLILDRGQILKILEGKIKAEPLIEWPKNEKKVLTIEEVEQEYKDAMAAFSEEAFWNEDFPGVDVYKDVDLDDSATASLKYGEEDEEDEETVVAIVKKKQKYNFERLVAGGRPTRDCDTCFRCYEKPCEFTEFESQVVAYVNGLAGIDGDAVKDSENGEVAKAHRYAMYREFTAYKHGYLGKGNRIQPPSCVVNGIRAYFPDPNHVYKGYVAKEW